MLKRANVKHKDIMTSRNKTHYTSEIYTLLDAGKYKEASQRAKILCEQYPDDIECTFLLSAALLNNKKYEKARKVILHGIERFPKEWRLHMLLGNVYGFLNKLSDAEKEYRRALAEAKRGSKADIAELHCSIAESLWAQSARESALIEWKQALEIDPECEEAKESLKECTNEYGEPKAPGPRFDDLYHFRTIHMERYFALVGRDVFISKEELNTVIKIISDGWNNSIPPRVKEFDRMTTEEKSRFCKSVTLDFKDAVERWKNDKNSRSDIPV